MSLLVQTAAVLYFFIPAYVANMAPVFFRRLPVLQWPLDGGRSVRGRRVLGDNKTVRGLVFGVLLAGAAFIVQRGLYLSGFEWFALVRYEEAALFSGFLMGFAALFGDMLESFVKRQLGIRPGGRLLFWDQMDFFLAALLVTIPAWSPYWLATIVAGAVLLVLTVLVQKIGYWLRLKDDPL